jgi:heme-degrading monooxygenase HmoA
MPQVILINPFEVPAGEDAAFLEAWGRARDFLTTQPGYLTTALHRSLAPDVEFRFVNVAPWQSAEAFRTATSRPEMRAIPFPFASHPSLYDIVFEEDLASGDGPGVVLINAFEVPPTADDDFIQAWHRGRDVLADKPGYLATRLHRALQPDADFRFVNIARYATVDAFRAAVGDPRFRAVAPPYRPHPGLYEVIASP